MTHTMLQTARRGTLAALVVALLLAPGGCARARTGDAGAGTAAGADTVAGAQWLGPVPIRVVNRHALDVTVFALVAGQRLRLGLVNSASSQSFELPLRLLAGGATLRLRAEPVGREEGITTEALSVQRGQRVEWMLESGLERSTVGVY